MAEQHRPLEGETMDDEDLAPRAFSGLSHRRALGVVAVLAALVLMALVPPLINVNRYKRQIANSIGASLGRPVHIDSVTLTVLPMPGFTLEQFVVGEDPAFGAEPVIRAAEVRATLRVSSLWRRRVEFSRISLADPSVNLVHLPDGRWNLESILLQASRMPAAPTAQKTAGGAQRFPYIEATGARVNLKMGLEKMPISLTEADFALWLPEPNEWHLRLKAHPARTDAAAMDTGLLRVEGTLGRAATLADVPVNLQATWSAAPLGGLSWLMMGRDGGMRGEMTLTANVRGSMGRNGVETRLELNRVRRADFVPARPIDADIRCTAQVNGIFHALDQVNCLWPGEADGSGLRVQGAVPDAMHPSMAEGSIVVKDVPVEVLLDAVRVASNRVAPELELSGAPISGEGLCCAHGSLTLAAGPGTLGLRGEKPFLAQALSAEVKDGALQVEPLALELGGRDPASLQVHADRNGYTLHLSGLATRARLDQLARAIPQFGDGLQSLLGPAAGADSPAKVDLMAARAWSGGQVWSAAPVSKPAGTRKSRR